MLNIFKKERKIKLTSHEKAIVITHLDIRKNQLQKIIDDCPNMNHWGIEHDIKCLEKAIVYLYL